MKVELRNLVSFKFDDEKADFWVQVKGTPQTIGTPKRSFHKGHVGITCGPTMDKNYLYYVFEYLKGNKFFTKLCQGTIRCEHLRISDLKEITFENGKVLLEHRRQVVEKKDAPQMNIPKKALEKIPCNFFIQRFDELKTAHDSMDASKDKKLKFTKLVILKNMELNYALSKLSGGN